MDLRFCPECKQSVLDDDVEECPFCGASMSGNSSTGKTPAQPPKKKRGLTPRSEAKSPPKSAPPASPEKKAAPPAKERSSAGRPGFLKDFGGASAPADDSEIFNFDTSRLRKAFQLRPKPQRGCTYRVICPMCETAGFAPHKIAGKEVRCRNKDCMVPVFEAPKVGGDRRNNAQEETRANPILIVAIVTIGVVLLGGGLFYWMSRPSSSDNLSQGNPNLANITNTDSNEGDKTPQVDEQEKFVDPFQGQKDVLREAQVKQARYVGDYTNNRSLADCRRMSAEIHALIQQPEKMQDDLDKLKVVGRQFPYYAIPALTEYGWQLLQAGDQQQTFDENFKAIQDLMGTLPGRGRFRIECAIRFAALAYASDNKEIAKQLAQKFDQRDDEALLSSAMYISERLDTWDIDVLLFRNLSQPWTSPLYSAVTIDLVTRLKRDLGLEWALAARENDVRSDCIVDWIRTVLQTPEANSTITDETLKQLVSSVKNPAHPVRVYAAMYLGLYPQGEEASLGYLKQAEEAASKYTIPDPLPVRSMKDILEVNLRSLPSIEDCLLEMQAFAELSRAESIAKKKDESWTYLKKSLQIGRNISPNPKLTRSFREAIESNSTRAQQQLFREINLNAASELSIKFAQYDRNLKVLEERAERRFRAQWTILARGLNWGLQSEVWQAVTSNDASGSSADMEPYVSTPLLQLLENRFTELGQKQFADNVNALLSRQDLLTEPTAVLVEGLAVNLAYDDIRAASSIINDSKVSVAEKELITLYFINRLVRKEKLIQAIDLTKRIEDPLMQEEAWKVMSGHAVASAQTEKYWALMRREDLTPTRWLSVCRGVIPELVGFFALLEEELPTPDSAP
ncbi:hypothetical protein Pla110_31310 [Polystyrenella longa]|uniref:Uncharacterized protein n=1 Tax=Polystyrenella longa TaxID=2528007 RepID=A0A518CQB0_9PLAN|nr:hypothetical protein [Polystyrenella longa]QDU81390.1 hypothetical protein Pla110_31310 [Polystyrenella longa]